MTDTKTIEALEKRIAELEAQVKPEKRADDLNDWVQDQRHETTQRTLAGLGQVTRDHKGSAVDTTGQKRSPQVAEVSEREQLAAEFDKIAVSPPGSATRAYEREAFIESKGKMKPGFWKDPMGRIRDRDGKIVPRDAL